MIDLDGIDAKCNAYLKSVGRSCSTILDVNEIKELVAYARQAEKDAARYRWLRDEAHFKRDNSPLAFFTDANGHWMEFDFDGSSYSILYDKVLDAAIDEAMQCK